MSTALMICFLISASAFAQVCINASLSGTVSDSSGALIPGVEVTARNTATGVQSISLTNESGTYRFASLQPGPYEVTAVLAGFQTQTFRLTLGTAQQIVQNFSLQVGTVAQAVEVTVAADELLTASTASVGTVLPSSQVVDLPVTGDGQASTTFGGITTNGCQCRHRHGRRHDEHGQTHAGPEDDVLRQSRHD